MLFAAEPRRCDLELLMPYLEAMSAAATNSPSSKAIDDTSAYSGAVRRRASFAPVPAAATVRVAPSTAATKKASQQFQKNHSSEGAGPLSPRLAVPPRPAMSPEKLPVKSSSPSAAAAAAPPSQPALVVHHQLLKNRAHVFSVDLPGRSMSSFEISVEERDGTGRMFIDVAAVESETERAIFIPRKALALSLDLPRDADLSIVSADYLDGVLQIKVPILKEEAPKRFKVVVGGGGGGKKEKEKEEEEGRAEEAGAEAGAEAKDSPSSPSSSLGAAAAAADLARVSVPQREKKKSDSSDDDDEEDGSWKAVSSDDDEEGEEEDSEEGDKKLSRPSSSSSAPASKKKNNKKKAPSGGAVLEAIEDADGDA